MGEGIVSSADSVSFLLGVLVLCFVVTSRPKNTDLFRTNLVGVIAMMVELAIEHVFLLFSGLVQYRFDSIVPFVILGLIYMVSHLTVITCLVIYISRLAVVRRYHERVHYALYTFLAVLYVVVGVVIFLRGDMVVLQNGVIIQNRFFNYIGYISIAVTALEIVASILNRKFYPRPLYKYIIVILPFMLVVEIVQLFHSEVIFTGFIFMMPLMTLFFLFHNNAYDQFTGCQDKATFGATVELLANRDHPYHLLYLRIPKLLDRDYATNHAVTQETLFAFWEACRQIEYLDSEVFLYKLRDGEYAIAYGSKEEDMPRLLANTRALINNSIESIADGMSYKAYHLPNAAILSSPAEAEYFFRYIVDYFGSNTGNEWFECDEQMLKNYSGYAKIRNVLVDIKDKRNLEDEHVLVYAQPIYDIKTKSFRTAEALMRMEIDYKMVFPDQFIPVAEKNDCIHALTLVILNKVCKKVVEWQSEYQIDAITVNCSSKELSDPRFASEIIGILEKNHTAPSDIRLEITEGGMFEDYSVVRKNLDALEAYGIRFYLDDYGTGYSNMERIFSCNFHTIKFDKSLLYRAMEDESVVNLLCSTIETFKQRGYRVLVEGVEDEAQLNQAREWGFEYVQGYYFSKPVPVENLVDYFTKKEEQV